MIKIIVRPTRMTARGRLWHANAPGAPNFELETLTPLLDAARALIARGIDPGGKLGMFHDEHGPAALTTTVGHAAGLAVTDRDGSLRFRKYTPFT